MKFKGTKGNWSVTVENNGNCFIHPLHGAAIARVYTDNEHENESEANAKLMQAAPELLDACIMFKKEGLNAQTSGAISNAIDKALN